MNKKIANDLELLTGLMISLAAAMSSAASPVIRCRGTDLERMAGTVSRMGDTISIIPDACRCEDGWVGVCKPICSDYQDYAGRCKQCEHDEACHIVTD